MKWLLVLVALPSVAVASEDAKILDKKIAAALAQYEHERILEGCVAAYPIVPTTGAQPGVPNRQVVVPRSLTPAERGMVVEITTLEHRLDTEKGTWSNHEARKKIHDRIRAVQKALARLRGEVCHRDLYP